MPAGDFKERRRYPRVKAAVPLELRHSAGAAPLRVTANEISAGGCYIETMFTLDVGTRVAMVIWLDNEKITAKGVVATRYPQVGNGIEIVQISPDDRAKLEAYLGKLRP
ncbi:MAG TPA: PilZ domain-containing protein [Terriglobales bacterium]|nr:PilZ domain-containing protein [Terriglobales bacterium]